MPAVIHGKETVSRSEGASAGDVCGYCVVCTVTTVYTVSISTMLQHRMASM